MMCVKTIVYNSNVSLFAFMNRHPSKRLASEFVQTVRTHFQPISSSTKIQTDTKSISLILLMPDRQHAKYRSSSPYRHPHYKNASQTEFLTSPSRLPVRVNLNIYHRRYKHAFKRRKDIANRTDDKKYLKDTVLPNNGKVIQHWQDTIYLCADSRRHQQRDLPVCCTNFSGLRSILHEISTRTWPPQRNKDFYHSIKITALCRQTNNNLQTSKGSELQFRVWWNERSIGSYGVHLRLLVVRATCRPHGDH